MGATIRFKYKAIGTLFPYTIRLEQGGRRKMFDEIFLAASTTSVSIFKWHHVWECVSAVFDESSPPSLNRVITLTSPYAPWHHGKFCTRSVVARWAAAALAVPYSEEVGQSVVNTLLQISVDDFLRSHIPFNIWLWLKKVVVEEAVVSPTRLPRANKWSPASCCSSSTRTWRR
jgi:hypothetical protein